MSEQSFEELLNENFKTIHTGEIVDGTVIDVKEDEIILNIGYKSDGIVTRNEYSSDNNLDLRTVANIGDEMKTKVIKINDGDGQVVLSYKKMIADAGSKKLEEAFENQTVLTAKVTQIMNGGLGVMVDETRVFIPASLVSDVYVKDLSTFKDKDVTFTIIEYNPRKRRIVGDCKSLYSCKQERKEAGNPLITSKKEKLLKVQLRTLHHLVHLSILAVLMDFFTFLKCLGEEQRTLQRFTR